MGFHLHSYILKWLIFIYDPQLKSLIPYIKDTWYRYYNPRSTRGESNYALMPKNFDFSKGGDRRNQRRIARSIPGDKTCKDDQFEPIACQAMVKRNQEFNKGT